MVRKLKSLKRSSDWICFDWGRAQSNQVLLTAYICPLYFYLPSHYLLTSCSWYESPATHPLSPSIPPYLLLPIVPIMLSQPHFRRYNKNKTEGMVWPMGWPTVWLKCMVNVMANSKAVNNVMLTVSIQIRTRGALLPTSGPVSRLKLSSTWTEVNITIIVRPSTPGDYIASLIIHWTGLTWVSQILRSYPELDRGVGGQVVGLAFHAQLRKVFGGSHSSQ